jgi:hypothetical protein
MSLTSQEQLVLERIRRDHECAVCGGILRLDWDGRIYCWNDASHEGTRKPRRTPPPYGIAWNKGQER